MNNYSIYLIENNKKNIEKINDNDINNIVELKDREFTILNNKRFYNISKFLIKNKVLVLKLDYIKAIICKNKVYLFDIKNSNVESFSDYLLKKLNNNNEHIFELNILELILSHLCIIFDNHLENIFKDFIELKNKINDDLEQITFSNETLNDEHDNQYQNSSFRLIKSKNSNSLNFNNLVIIHNKLITFETRVNDVKDVIEELLENDEDMANIYISRENNPIKNHNEVELILENYEKHIQEILNEISGMLKELDINQRVMNLNYANSRNKIALWNLKISYVTLTITSLTLIPSIFGMNIKNGIEDNLSVFISILILLIFTAIVVSIFLFSMNLQNKLL